MSNLFLLFLCLFLGIFFRKLNLFPKNSSDVLNAFVINISLPSLAIYFIPKIEMNASVIFPVLVAWIGIFSAFAFFSVLGKNLDWSKSVIGALILCAGFGNTSFVGIPIIQALYGEHGIKTVMLVDQPGSFVALSTVGILFANLYSGGKVSAKELMIKLFRFPPFIGFLIGLLLNIISFALPKDLDEVFNKLGATTVPLALISVGMQLRVPKLDHDTKYLIWGLLFKLMIYPLIIFVLYCIIFKQRGQEAEISVLEAAMAPMITAGIIASAHKLEPKLCNMMIGVGIPLSFITVGFWYLLLRVF